MSETTLTLPAPAKLNLMLHITGQRDDGYHNLQTLFQILDYSDELTFETSDTGEVRLDTPMAGVAEADNLIVRAAHLLKQASGSLCGARISIAKRLPMGAGLGGGSSNAATTLVGLNALWQTGLGLAELAEIGLSLGADVPVFVHGVSAWAEGVGEKLEKVVLPTPWFVVITPPCEISTGHIFSHRQLTRNTSPITIAAALGYGGFNDCEALVKELYPDVKMALEWLNQFANARLTGTGSSIFASFDSQTQAEQVVAQLPRHWSGFSAHGVNLSPLHQVVKISTVL